jgi:hypothetical protein
MSTTASAAFLKLSGAIRRQDYGVENGLIFCPYPVKSEER